jgi:hypothetical protein
MMPESRKLRTIPTRMTKPQYRALLALLEITGASIQEMLRESLTDYIEKRRKALLAAGARFPSEFVLGEMGDAEFGRWLSGPANEMKRPDKKVGGLKTRPASVPTPA